MSNSAALIFFSLLAMVVVGVFALIAVYMVRHRRAEAEAKRSELAQQEQAPAMIEAFPTSFKSASEAAQEFADDASLKQNLVYARYYFQLAVNALRVENKREAYLHISTAEKQLHYFDGTMAALRTNRQSDALLGVNPGPINLPPPSEFEEFWFC